MTTPPKRSIHGPDSSGRHTAGAAATPTIKSIAMAMLPVGHPARRAPTGVAAQPPIGPGLGGTAPHVNAKKAGRVTGKGVGQRLGSQQQQADDRH